MKVKLAMLMQIIKIDPTLQRLAKKAVSKESSKLFSDLERKINKSRATPQEKEEKTSIW